MRSQDASPGETHELFWKCVGFATAGAISAGGWFVIAIAVLHVFR